MRPTFDELFMLMAKLVAVRSTCNSRPQGAVLVRDRRIVATGYNGALPGQEHCSDQPLVWICPTCNGSGRFHNYIFDICPQCKGFGNQPYCRRRAANVPDAQKDRACVSAHAEANAVAQAARMGISVEGATLYCTTRPCVPCMKLLVQAGVTRGFYELDYDDPIQDNFLAVVMNLRQLAVSPEALAQAMAMLQPETSRRRLGRTE